MASPRIRFSSWCSILRNAGSPSWEKMAEIGRFARSTMRLSRSAWTHPIWRASSRATVDFPQPIKPVNAISRRLTRAFAADVPLEWILLLEWGASITLVDIDYTIEGRQFELGAALVEAPE